MFVGPSAVRFSKRRPALLRKCFVCVVGSALSRDLWTILVTVLGFSRVSVSVEALRVSRHAVAEHVFENPRIPVLYFSLSVQIRYMIRPESGQIVQ